MRLPLLRAALALTILVPVACSSFGASDDEDAGPAVDGPEGGGDGAADSAAQPDASASRARTLYVFGGVTIVANTEEPVFEAYAASILDDGSLGSWERAPALDVIRSYMTTIAVPDGPLIMAGGNGMPIGQGASGNFIFFRDDVGVAGGDPLGSWTGAPSLGAGNGRWGAPGTFASGNAYLGGGMVTGGGFTNTVMAAPVTGSPPAVQPWKKVGTLPFAMADHGLVALGSSLYVIGGSSTREGGTVVSADTFMAPIAGDATVSGWVATGSLPNAREAFGVVGIDSRVLVIGGGDGASNVAASVFIGSQTATQDLIWQETTPMKHARQHLCVLRANGRVYAIGGAGVGSVTQVVEVGEVSGTSMTWKETTPMPVTRSALGCAAR